MDLLETLHFVNPTTWNPIDFPSRGIVNYHIQQPSQSIQHRLFEFVGVTRRRPVAGRSTTIRI